MHTLGKLIAIEGLEGAGKSTAVAVVLDVLRQHTIEAIATREPGGTSISEELRKILKNQAWQGLMDPRTELLLIYASRIQLVEEVIRPALNQGLWVVVDRFELSTLAYQGGGRGLDESMIQRLSSFCLQGLKPDLTLFMDISPEAGMQRARQRAELDRFEKEEDQFFTRVYDAYRNYVNHTPNILKIDASQSLDRVKEDIQKKVTQFIPATR